MSLVESAKLDALDLLENSHGFVVWIDRNGLIGMVDYDHRFRHPVGAHHGNDDRAGRAAVLSLEIGDDNPLMRGVRMGVRRFPEGYTLRVRLTLETVNEIGFSNPAAEYPEPTEPSYPAAVGMAGAPLADPNLKLVVLSSLLDAKQIDLGTPAQLASNVLGRAVDLEDEGYEIIPEAQDYLERYPLTDELLAAVEEIAFDDGGTAYRFAWYFWDGRCLRREGPVRYRALQEPQKLFRNLDDRKGRRAPASIIPEIGTPEAQYRDRPHRSTARLADAERSESSRRRDL
ncbi:hypothetical protein IE4872_CH01907 [Rhizobium gallicum]|uniref:Uncharacterized protein n=1 Tax=Rhizobium gallicum TaxID=56730 RepID=A0A1L5NI06_9HYPH|nr:hypothetical protein [Rhizobium gallicum]APO67527.1 hypothetical protein IE4872_CH01907 [Rhizobium gallicum]